MKISLVTIWHVCNYGAELQAYALIKVLHDMGHDVEMIDVRLSDALPCTFKYKIARLINQTSFLLNKFNKFWKLYIPTTKRYHSIEELQKDPPISDVYIVGSDQVWNPSITTTLAKVFFLDFGSPSIKRISYASSFGFSEFLDSSIFDMKYGQLLRNFNSISCREDTGLQLLYKLNVAAVNVLDPTLLLSEYKELVGTLVEKNTLAYYPVGNSLNDIEEFSKELAEKSNLQFNNLMQRTYKLWRFGCDGLSVQDWIRNIAEARIVVTTSFHGVAFSLIYKRQFIVIINNTERGSRITDLLDKLNLSDRYFFSVNEAKRSSVWDKLIDYNIVLDKLERLRDESFAFLKNALNGK